MFSGVPAIFDTARAYAKLEWGDSSKQFNLELSVVMQDNIKITFGDGSWIQIRPENIYPITKEGNDVLIIQGDGMFQTPTPSSWCGIKDLKLRLVSYGPPKEPSDEKQKVVEPSILTKIKKMFDGEPKFALLPSNRRYIIPQWWSKIPTLTEEHGFARVDSSLHRNLLENVYWPIENFNQVKTLKLVRMVTMNTTTKC